MSPPFLALRVVNELQTLPHSHAPARASSNGYYFVGGGSIRPDDFVTGDGIHLRQDECFHY